MSEKTPSYRRRAAPLRIQLCPGGRRQQMQLRLDVIEPGRVQKKIYRATEVSGASPGKSRDEGSGGSHMVIPCLRYCVQCAAEIQSLADCPLEYPAWSEATPCIQPAPEVDENLSLRVLQALEVVYESRSTDQTRRPSRSPSECVMNQDELFGAIRLAHRYHLADDAFRRLQPEPPAEKPACRARTFMANGQPRPISSAARSEQFLQDAWPEPVKAGIGDMFDTGQERCIGHAHNAAISAEQMPATCASRSGLPSASRIPGGSPPPLHARRCRQREMPPMSRHRQQWPADHRRRSARQGGHA